MLLIILLSDSRDVYVSLLSTNTVAALQRTQVTSYALFPRYSFIQSLPLQTPNVHVFQVFQVF